MRRSRIAPKGKVPVVEIAPRDSARLYDLADEFPSGAYVNLTDGEYHFLKTAILPSNTTVTGAGRERTRIVLEKGCNCHLFTNSEHNKGNKNIAFAGFSVDGNGGDQEFSPGDKPVMLCCGIYLRRVAGVQIQDCSFNDIRQTAAHLTECRNVVVNEFRSRKVGWSGISTNNSSDVWVEAIVEEAGWDGSHPGVHIDGGLGVYVDATVTDVNGNGIVLESAYSDLAKCVVKGSASRCLCGVFLRGTPEKELRDVYIEGVFAANAELGILVSNSTNIVIARSLVHGNGIAGIRFQGRNGGRDCLVVDTIVADNPVAYEHLHASGSNWIFDPQGTGDESADAIRQGTLAQRQRALAEKRQRKLAASVSSSTAAATPAGTKGAKKPRRKKAPPAAG